INTPTGIYTPAKAEGSTKFSSPHKDNVPSRYTTSSTCSPTSIRPTVFTRGTRFEQENRLKAERVRRMLEDVPDHLVREMLKAPRYQNLLATQPRSQPEVDLQGSHGSEPIAVAQVESIVEGYMDRYIKGCFNALTKDAFKAHARQRLDHLVETGLPVAAELFLSGAVEKHRDQFYEDCRIFESHLHETVEEGRTELLAKANECSTEIEELAQKRIMELQDQGGEVGLLVFEQIEKLEHWSSKHTQPAVKESHLPRTMARCKSV
ncbi:hypothetical protein D6C77_10800, partial [Aureobasidium pullulans]